MSYNFKLFNPERKNRFLNEEYPNESTRTTYGSLLAKISQYEQDKNKDVCDFSYNEAVELMIGLKKKTDNSLGVAQSMIGRYVDWCINPDQGYSAPPNIFKLINKEDKSKYTHQIAKKNTYIDREKMYEYCSRLFNYTDQSFLVLLFEGLRGRTEVNNSFEELRNFKMTDVIPELNTIIATRNNGERNVMKVDKRTIDVLVYASQQTEYHRANGQATGKFAIFPLQDNGYLLRTIENNNNNEDNKITISSLNSKFRKIREYTEVSFLTPTSLFQSGLIERCEILEQEIGELQPENFRQIYKDLKINEKRWSNLRQIYELYKKNKGNIVARE